VHARVHFFLITSEDILSSDKRWRDDEEKTFFVCWVWPVPHDSIQTEIHILMWPNSLTGQH